MRVKKENKKLNFKIKATMLMIVAILIIVGTSIASNYIVDALINFCKFILLVEITTLQRIINIMFTSTAFIAALEVLYKLNNKGE